MIPRLRPNTPPKNAHRVEFQDDFRTFLAVPFAFLTKVVGCPDLAIRCVRAGRADDADPANGDGYGSLIREYVEGHDEGSTQSDNPLSPTGFRPCN